MVGIVLPRCVACGAGYPRCYGVADTTDGRVRYHWCYECGTRFCSVELDPSVLRGITLPGGNG